MCDEAGEPLAPCECGYAICRDCYIEALDAGGKCLGCKHFYKSADPERRNINSRMPGHGNPRGEDHEDEDEDSDDTFRIPAMSKEQAFERRLSLLRSFKASSNPPLLMGKHTSEFDHARWLFESKGTYGYGNAVWPKDSGFIGGGAAGSAAGNAAPPDFGNSRRQPLSRKKGISAGIISPYR
jgi:hypothetical protein